jgi:hypothetical protein
MFQKFTLKDKVYQELLLLTANDKFIEDVEKIRKKCKEKSEEILDEEKKLFFADYSQTDDYQKDIEKLRRKYKLSNLYQFPLYLFCKSKKDMPDLRSLEELWETDKPESVLILRNPNILNIWAEINQPLSLDEILTELENHIVLKLYPETTKKDIIESWSKISKEKNRLFKIKSSRNSKRNNIIRDLKIYKLKKQGKTCMEITRIINKDGKYKKQKISYEEVSKIIKRLKNRAKKLGATKKT